MQADHFTAVTRYTFIMILDFIDETQFFFFFAWLKLKCDFCSFIKPLAAVKYSVFIQIISNVVVQN